MIESFSGSNNYCHKYPFKLQVHLMPIHMTLWHYSYLSIKNIDVLRVIVD